MSYDLEQAFLDLAAIRRAVERTQGSKGTPRILGFALGADIYIQAAAFVCCAIFLLSELFTRHAGTAGLMLSTKYVWLRQSGLQSTGILLVILVALLYAVVFSAARSAKATTQDLLQQYFTYLKNFSLLSDLLVKYIVFCLIVLAQRPEWVAPMLILFVGDYLLQGRFFSLPVRIALPAGLLCVGLAGLQFYTRSVLLVWPFMVFCAVSLASVAYLIRQRRAGAAQ